jgi:hypothetical protein
MFISTRLWLMQCGENYGFIHIKGACYHFFICLGNYLLFPLGLQPLWMQFQMKFPTLFYNMPIQITMNIRIPTFFGCGYHIIVFSLVVFFLALMLLPLLGVQINIKILLIRLIYDFHSKKLQLPSDMVENSSKVLHHHPSLFQRDTQLDGLPLEFRSVFLHPLSSFLLKVLSFHEFLLFVAYGINS